MEFIAELLHNPLLLLTVILFLGTWIGQIKVKGLSLGTAGVLLVAIFFGNFGYQISSTVQNFGLALFIVAVGLQAGPHFFRMMRSSGLIFGIISIIIVFVSFVTTIIVSKVLHLSEGLSVGIMAGALTSTPGLAAALEATNNPLASVGYGIAYPFGILAIVLFVQLLPKISQVDLIEDLNRTNNPIKNEKSPEVIAIEVTNSSLHKRTIRELKILRNSVVISRVIRNKHTIIALSDTVILYGDKLVMVGEIGEIKKCRAYIGKEVSVDFKNIDHIQPRKVTVDSDDVIGKNIKELRLRRDYGVTVTRKERAGIELNLNPGTRLERGDILTIVSSADRLEKVEELFVRKKVDVTNVHILSLSIILLIGILLGMIPFHLAGLGTIKLGVAGGPLIAALIIGHFGKLGPIHVRYYGPSNQVISDLGLVIFLAGAGTTAGHGLVDVIQSEGIRLLIGGILITTIPIVIGYVVARFLFKFSIVHSLGALCGGMTSTPGLGAIKQLTDSESPAIAYAAAYPFSLILVALSSQLIVLFL